MSDLASRGAASNMDVASPVGIGDVHEVRLRGLLPVSAASDARSQVDLFVQASQVAENLRAQVNELERRERNLNEQLAQFDREQRSLRMRAQNAEEELHLRTEQLAQQEQQFAERFQETEQLLAELKLRERELTQANATLEQQRVMLRQQLERQLDVDKAAMQQSQSLADSERKQLHEERERLQREQQAILETVKQEIEQEKLRLRKEYAWELDREIEVFRSQRDAWETQKTRDQGQLAADQRIQEDGLQKVQAEWAELRRQQQADLDTTRRQLDNQRQQLQREHDEALRRLQLNWESERQSLRVQWAADLDDEKRRFAIEQVEFATSRDAERSVVHRDRETHDSYVQKSLAELQNQRKQLEADLKQAREEHAKQLRADLGETNQLKLTWEQERTARMARLNEMQFEIEAAQQEAAKSWQSSQAEIAKRTTDLDLRESQLQRYRQRLDAREVLLVSQSETARRLHADRAHDLDTQRRQFDKERQEWGQRLQADQESIRQQQEQRGLDLEKLDARRQRLEMMRSEMEGANRLALEARLVMEEVWAELLPAVDQETARRRIETGRAAIAEHYRRLRDEMELERQELQLERLQFQDHYRRQQDQLRAEKEQRPASLAIREEQVRLNEQRLKAEAEEWEKRESKWRAARIQWLDEKQEAEQIIRGLLDQLTDLERTTDLTSTTPSVLPFVKNSKTVA